MELNRHTVEAWLLDRMEGRLDAGQELRLKEFLKLHPDLAMEGEVPSWSLETGGPSYPLKKELYRNIPDEHTPVEKAQFDMLAIARLEGDLTRDQEETFDHLVQEEEDLAAEWAQWEKTRLPAEEVVYPEKGRLKKIQPRVVRVRWMAALSMAAAIALLLVLFNTGPLVPEAPVEELAVQTESKQTGTGQAEALPGTEAGAEEPADEPKPRNPASLITRKHADPPALTGKAMKSAELTQELGMHQESAGTETGPDSPSHGPLPERLKPRSMKLALHLGTAYPVRTGMRKDRIEPGALQAPVPSGAAALNWAQISNKGLKETTREFLEEKNITLYTVASAGLEGINRLTGSDLSLNMDRGEKGEASGFRFRSRIMSVDAPRRKPDTE
jgi:hypothetical protein